MFTYEGAEEFIDALVPVIRAIVAKEMQNTLKCWVATVKSVDNEARKATVLLAASEDDPSQYIEFDNQTGCLLEAGDEVWVVAWHGLTNGVIFAKIKTGDEIFF